MGHYIVYKGAGDQYRWRQVDPESGTTDTLVVDGQPSYSGLFLSKEEAIADIQSKDPDAVIKDREAELEEINKQRAAEKEAQRKAQSESTEAGEVTIQ